MLRMVVLTLAIVTLIIPNLALSKNYGRSLCDQEGYTCIKIKRGQSWQSLWPDDHDRDIVMRVNRLNVRIYPGQVIAVPDDLSQKDVLDYAPFPKQITSNNEKLLIFDPKQLAFGAYDADGLLIRWGPAAGGNSWCKDIGKSCRTSVGQFRIYSAGSSECYSRKFPVPRGGAPMPYCMFFKGGMAFHGSPNGLVGYNASHGCIRLYVSDAEWLRYNFVELPKSYNNYRGTKVIVKSY